MISLVHAAVALAAWAFLWRGLERSGFAASAPGPSIAAAFAIAALVASAAGSAGAIAAGRTVWTPRRALIVDALSLSAAAWAFAVVSLAPWTRELGGVVLIAIVAVRLAPAALAVVVGAPAWVAMIVAAGAYAAMAAWLTVASLPFGDQVHYLLVADGLAQGRIDLTIDARLFVEMIGSQPNADDIATHVAQTPAGPRPIQGYALPLLALPGWIAFGRLGAALIATAYRFGFTAPVPRPALAAGLLAATLFLTPRDAVPLLVLLPFLLRDPMTRRRVAVAAGSVALAAVVANALLYGLPIPYAGYAFGTAQAQAVTQQGSITPFVWVTGPAILFDRTFGLLGTAPWVFVGLLGLLPALRTDRPRLMPAAVAVGASVVALSFFRLWEGGYAPPARYFVDVLPLWTPFVAYSLAAARGWIERAIVAVLIGTSAVTSLILAAVPTLALNTAFEDRIRDAVGRVTGIDPLAWLPSFQPVAADWYVLAYLTLLPAVALATALVWLGARPRPLTLAADPLITFALANAALIGVVLVAALQPWIEGNDPVPSSLLRRWLPLSLAFASAGTALVSRAIERNEREGFLRRHFWIYLIPLGLMLVAHFGGSGLVNGQLGAVYLLIAVAFAVHALAALWRAIDRLRDRAAALQLAAVALVAMAVLLPYHRAVMPTASDEPHYLIVTQSLLYDGDLDVRNDYAGDRYRAFYPERLPDMHAVPVGAAVFSVRDPALPILSVVPFGVGGRLGVLALMCLVGAALVAQLYLLLRDLRFAPRIALLATASTALAHPIFTYTTQVYPELLAVLAFVSVARVVRGGRAITIGQLAVASVLTGALPWLSTRAWPVVVGVGLAIAWCAIAPYRDRPAWLPRRLAAGAGPFLALVLALSLLNWLTFGLFMPSAGYFLIRENQPVLTYTPWIGVPGLLFDRAFGLIPRAPVYLLAFVGLIPLWRRMRDGHGTQIAALGLGSVLSFVYIADIHYWWADGSPPSRYALGSIPLLIAAVAAGWEIALARAWSRALAAGAVIASALVVYVYAVLPNLRYDIAVEIRASESSGALFDFLARAVGIDLGLAFPSLVRADPVSAALALGWIAVAVALVVAGSRSAPLPSRG